MSPFPFRNGNERNSRLGRPLSTIARAVRVDGRNVVESAEVWKSHIGEPAFG